MSFRFHNSALLWGKIGKNCLKMNIHTLFSIATKLVNWVTMEFFRLSSMMSDFSCALFI